MSSETIRAKFFSSKNRRKKVVAVELEGEPVEIEFRAPTIAVRTKILDLLHVNKDTKASVQEHEDAKMRAVLACAFAPGEDAPLFNERDRDNLLSQADAFDEIAKHCMEVILPKKEELEAKAEADEKNSETTPSNT